MSKTHNRRRPNRQDSPSPSAPKSEPFSQAHSQQLQKRHVILTAVILLAMSIIFSALFWGHQTVPNSDFRSFLTVGRDLLHFESPSDYKRAPGLGLILAALSHLMPDQHPGLTAGWVLNSLLFPLNTLLLFLLARKIVPHAAPWLAIIVTINPWTMKLLVDPIAETTLLFFILATFVLAFRKSRWAYLCAGLGFLIRYDGAFLILAVFVLDVIHNKTLRQRLLALALSVIAALPMLIWILATLLSWKQQDQSHYLKSAGAGGFHLTEYLNTLWAVSIQPLLIPFPSNAQNAGAILYPITKILTAVLALAAIGYGIAKKNWNILALLIFFIGSFIVIATRPGVSERYCFGILWLTLLFCAAGVQALCQIIQKLIHVPRPAAITLNLILIVVAVIWITGLVEELPKPAPQGHAMTSAAFKSTIAADNKDHTLRFINHTPLPSNTIGSIPKITIVAAIIILIISLFTIRRAKPLTPIAITTVIILNILANQYVIGPYLGSGKLDIEFKRLADWHYQNAQPGEKLLTTMPGLLKMFNAKHQDDFIHKAGLIAESPEQFLQLCYQRNITYIAWDSRIGLTSPDYSYYKTWRIDNLKMLAKPRSIGPFQYLQTIPGDHRSRFIHLFRLQEKQP